MDQELIDQVFPRAGFFGAADFNCLRAPVGMELDSIELILDGPLPEYLNLGEIGFFRGGQPLSNAQLIAEVMMTSTSKGLTYAQQREAVIAGRPIHSGREPTPALKIRFAQSEWIDEICIRNRWDRFGRRSRFLVLLGRRREFTAFRYRHRDAQCNEIELQKLMEAAVGHLAPAQRPNLVVPTDVKEADRLRKTLKTIILSVVYAGIAPLEVFNWKLISSMLCNGGQFGNDEKDTDISLLAAYVVHFLNPERCFETIMLAPFEDILRGQTEVRRLMDQINSLPALRIKTNERMIISKHAIHPSQLITKRVDFLQALRQALDILAHLDIEGAICYGTLLGSARNRDFIEHDDDVDLIYLDPSSNNEEAALFRSRELQASFERKNFSSWRGSGSLHFNVSYRGPTVDIFPVWFSGRQAFLMMEQFKVRPISAEIIRPLSTVELCGATFPAPGNVAGFLEERYGPTWRTPNAFHEWPWELDVIK